MIPRSLYIIGSREMVRVTLPDNMFNEVTLPLR